jgi:hypothetical protein
VADLVTAGLAAEPTTSTAESDPNDLLGRPNGYRSRATFTIPGVEAGSDDPEDCNRGGCVEQWPDAGAAQDRADRIGEIGKRLPAAGEYTYARDDGMLLRVSRAATPAKADELRAAFFDG